MNQLDALKKYTKIVADSGDIESIRLYHPVDVTTNPSLILKAAMMPEYQYLVIDSIRYAKNHEHTTEKQLIHAIDKIAINIGIEILKNISGRISTEIDVRLSFNTKRCIEKAFKLIHMYKEEGIDASRVLIKLASTWEGIRAAEILEQEGINCNMTLLFSFAQARACADAGVFLISPFVGRVSDWYLSRKLICNYNGDNDPGVKFVRKIFNYYKKYHYPTVIMGASFRTTEQIIALTGCDYLTIAPLLLQQLSKNQTEIKPKLIYPTKSESPPANISESFFRWEHNEDAMAVEKLSEGIRLFAKDQQQLESLFLKYLR
ncbi:MAG: transaldolase [Candidatus Dasytiphilus stammeri]